MPLHDDELTYRVVQTVKGSLSSLGPLQCESTCSIKAPTPVCDYQVPDCALECRNKCERRAATRFGFRRRVCIEGCTLFCPFAKPDCCPDAPDEPEE